MEEKIKVIEEEVGADKSQGALKDLSQKELEDKMAATRDELEEAKSNKEFAKCSDLQVKYPRHLRHLRHHCSRAALAKAMLRNHRDALCTGSHKVRATTKTIKTRKAQQYGHTELEKRTTVRSWVTLRERLI